MLQSDVRERRLYWPLAILYSFLGVEIGHLPRFRNEQGKEQKIDEDLIIAIIATELEGIAGPEDPDALDALIKHGRESLDEVKALTEYEDQKATRLLTIVAFLSALAGVLFTRYVEFYVSPLQAQRYCVRHP
jgi:hypothetical protein